ncbi:NAD(P)H azoreductase [Fusarium austroafricanum]|uniref:NAD(P)H azoreductase n=1 Tax=Fusarium austroafricanum TaxID=2364996 RepID=A0A8H4KP49_9HYPO|nr:NAD(P)H azoreductase [Fusarium austroafricanum]
MSNTQNPTVYVVAATGAQGSAVCRQLRQLNWSVRATVRNLESPAAQALAQLGVALNRGDWDDEEALATGLAGCNKLFLALYPNFSNLDDERVWAQRILALAKKAGVEDIVYTSSISADAPEKRTLLSPNHLIFKSLFVKNVNEGMVQRADFAHWTILRPGFFMNNLLAPKARIYDDLLERGTWLTAMKPETKLNLIDTEDIARFAVAAMRDPERFHGHGIDLVGERLTAVQMMEVLSKAVGREMKAEFHSDEEVAKAIGTNPFIGSQVFLRDGEQCVDPEKVKAWGIAMGTFENFLAREKAAAVETYLSK